MLGKFKLTSPGTFNGDYGGCIFDNNIFIAETKRDLRLIERMMILDPTIIEIEEEKNVEKTVNIPKPDVKKRTANDTENGGVDTSSKKIGRPPNSSRNRQKVNGQNKRNNK